MSTIITFIVDTIQQVFTIPRLLIEEDTFLARYLSFNGKKIMQEDAYVLPDENSHLFNIFHSFLLGGDFDWNEEICQYFDYMGYINSLDYPLDFWKIKLRDNWIRHNFYRLQLWRPRSSDVIEDLDKVRNLLLIEPGPYVGLVDLTSTFRSNLISVPRTTIKDLAVFNEIINFSQGKVILAGGALVTFLYGDDRMPPDLDIFITTKDEDYANDTIKSIINNYAQLNRHNMRLHLISANCGKVVRTENAITIGLLKPKYQVILRLYTCPSEVVHGFDLDASGIFYDGKSVWATQRAAYSLHHKINFFDFARMSPTYGYRLAKYASRGFQVWLPHLNPDLILWNDLKRMVHNIADIYEIRDDVAAITSYAPYFTLKYRDTQILRDTVEFKEILRKNNPLDLIIFAMYFKYLPNLHLSDYTVRPDKDKITKIHCGEFSRDSTKNSSITTIEAEWWEIVGRGYVVFNHSLIEYERLRGSYTKISTAPIFNLNAKSCQGSGLTPQPKWKAQDPMQQLTGTFNPTTLKDLQEWYDTALLYGTISKLFPSKSLKETPSPVDPF